MKKHNLCLALTIWSLPFLACAKLGEPQVDAKDYGKGDYGTPTTVQNHMPVIIRAISGSRKTFVTNQGLLNGLMEGQKSYFQTPDTNIAVRAVKVSRYETLWEVADPEAQVPFNKDDIVMFTNSMEAMGIHFAPKIREENLNSLALRGSYSMSVGNSASEVSSGAERSRSAFSGDILAAREYNKAVSYGAGFRMDREQVDATFAILNNVRYIAYGDVSFHLNSLTQSALNWALSQDQVRSVRPYAGIQVGGGQSVMTVDDTRVGGQVLLLPGARAGLEMNLGPTWIFLFEGGAESLFVRERYEDSSSQTTNVINVRIGVGLKALL